MLVGASNAATAGQGARVGKVGSKMNKKSRNVNYYAQLIANY
jgi:hypothetical protein